MIRMGNLLTVCSVLCSVRLVVILYNVVLVGRKKIENLNRKVWNAYVNLGIKKTIIVNARNALFIKTNVCFNAQKILF